MLLETKNVLSKLIVNPVFLSCIFSWFGAQFIKTLIKLLCGKIHSLKELIELLLWRTGGMPSSHSAIVVGLTTSIGFNSGVLSDVFILSICFTLVVIRDAVGVRRSSGIQAKVLNEIGQELSNKEIINFKQIKEIQGHTPLEVIVGCLLGFFIGIAFSVL